MCSRGNKWILPSDGELQAELMEIDENLIRAELSPAQRAAAIKRRKVIWEALHPESGTNCSTLPATGRGHVQFAADTAHAANMTKQDINRHLSRADALGDDLQKVEGTSLDKGVELDALKAMPPEVRAHQEHSRWLQIGYRIKKSQLLRLAFLLDFNVSL